MTPRATPPQEPLHVAIFGGTGRTGRHLVERAVESAGAGAGGEGDQPKLLNHLISFALELAARHVLEDMTRTVQAVRDSDLDWTVVRSAAPVT